MTTALYIRVSTEEQAQQGYSLEDQKERLIAFCKSQGLDDFKLYMDDGQTGTNINRPSLKRLIKHVENKKISMVIVYKLDRLSRKQKDVLYLLEDVFEKNNVAFKSATEPFDTSTPLGKAMIGILAVFAQLERDMIVERTASGRRQRVNQGIWYGGREPFGYKWNKESLSLEIIPEQAQIVKEIYKQYLQGKSRLAIAEWVSKRSKARFFDHSVIRDMLERPVYMGKLMNSGELVEGKHDAIIDEKTWAAVQRECNNRSGGLPPVGEFLLTGLLRCGVCGGPIVHVKRITHKYGKTYQYDLYACKNQHVRAKDRTNNCTLGYKRREKVEQFVTDEIKSVPLKPQKINDYIERMTDEKDDPQLLKELMEKSQKISSSLENLYDAIQSGDIKASAVSSRIAKLEEERAAFDQQIEDLNDSSPKYKESNQMYALVKEIGKTWDRFTLDEQKELIRKIITKIIFHSNDNPEILWNIAE